MTLSLLINSYGGERGGKLSHQVEYLLLNNISITNLYIDIDLLLEDKFNIPVKDYFKLKASDRSDLAQLIIKAVFQKFQTDKTSIPFYIDMVNMRMKESAAVDEFELADLYKRIKLNLIQIAIEP